MNPIVILGGVVILGAIALFATKSKAGKKGKGRKKMYGPEEKLSKNFKLKEFMRSRVAPELATYPVGESMWNSNLVLVTQILQPLRDMFGVIRITAGNRPPDFRDSSGKGMYELLEEAGYSPAVDSDHNYGLAAGIIPADKSKAMGLWDHLKTIPSVRQAILYLHTQDDGKVTVGHIHVAVKAKFRRPISPSNRFFTMLDGKRKENAVS